LYLENTKIYIMTQKDIEDIVVEMVTWMTNETTKRQLDITNFDVERITKKEEELKRFERRLFKYWDFKLGNNLDDALSLLFERTNTFLFDAPKRDQLLITNGDRIIIWYNAHIEPISL
jgi:hypothetical protein